MLSTPILFLVFNRLESTKQVFAKIKEIKPTQLFIASDGYRENKDNEREVVESVRNYVLQNIDWDCEVKTLFREKNLGCGLAVSGAITWFFDHVEKGIILEDDCLPDLSFFNFCDELLTKYQDENKIMSISGTNLLGKWKENEKSYFYNFGGIWGWATWSRAWKLYNYSIKDWEKPEVKLKIKNKFNNKYWFEMYSNMFDSVSSGNLDTWDAQWLYTVLINDSFSITPAVNLIKNIGFNELGTHTNNTNEFIERIKLFEINFPLKHPNNKIHELEFDKKYAKFFIKSNNVSLINRIINKLKRIIKYIILK